MFVTMRHVCHNASSIANITLTAQHIWEVDESVRSSAKMGQCQLALQELCSSCMQHASAACKTLAVSTFICSETAKMVNTSPLDNAMLLSEVHIGHHHRVQDVVMASHFILIIVKVH